MPWSSPGSLKSWDATVYLGNTTPRGCQGGWVGKIAALQPYAHPEHLGRDPPSRLPKPRPRLRRRLSAHTSYRAQPAAPGSGEGRDGAQPALGAVRQALPIRGRLPAHRHTHESKHANIRPSLGRYVPPLLRTLWQKGKALGARSSFTTRLSSAQGLYE